MSGVGWAAPTKSWMDKTDKWHYKEKEVLL